MKRLLIFILCVICASAVQVYAQTDSRMVQPDLQTTEFFDPTKEKNELPYQFSTDWRIEAGYVQSNERKLDTLAVYKHGIRLGATIDFNLPHNFSVQTGALATLTYGVDEQHWRSQSQESSQIEVINHNLVQLQLTIPVRAYYHITLWKELRMFFFAGPQLHIGLLNYDIIDNQISDLCTEWLQSIGARLDNYDRYAQKEIFRSNIQFGIGGGLEWDRYRLQAGYDFGLNNLQRASLLPNQTMNEWGWMCTFSYKF